MKDNTVNIFIRSLRQMHKKGRMKKENQGDLYIKHPLKCINNTNQGIDIYIRWYEKNILITFRDLDHANNCDLTLCISFVTCDINSWNSESKSIIQNIKIAKDWHHMVSSTGLYFYLFFFSFFSSLIQSDTIIRLNLVAWDNVTIMMMATMIDRLTCCNCFVNSEMKLRQNHFHLQHLGISVQPALIGSPANRGKNYQDQKWLYLPFLPMYRSTD